MSDSTTQAAGSRLLLNLAAVVVVVAGLRAAADLLVPILLAAFLAVLCAPPMFWMMRRKVPQALAVLLVAVGISLVLVAVAALVGSAAADFTASLPEYKARLSTLTGGLLDWLSSLGLPASAPALREALDPGKALSVVGGMLGGLGNALADLMLIVLTILFILFEAASFPAKLRLLAGSRGTESPGFRKATQDIIRYMVIKSWISLATGLGVGVWLAVQGVKYPVLWAVLAFFLNFVPSIGSIIAAVPAVLLALVQLGGGAALWAAAGFLLVNTVMGNVVEPKVMGKGLGLSTLVVFLSLVFWGWVLGPVGMFLSVPLTMVLKIGLESREDTRWIAVLLGSEHDIPQEEEAAS